jgi:hypothetical protein
MNEARRSPGQGVLAVLPLQIGTTATWSAGRAAAALFPGLAVIGAGVAVVATVHSVRLGLAVVAPGALLVAYALGHVLGAVRNRASDVMLLATGLVIDGGRLHGSAMPWTELTPPFAEVEETTARRITLKSIALVLLSMTVQRLLVRGATEPVKVWRLHVYHRGQRRMVAETDRGIERDSMGAAAASVCAVVSGQRYVAQAPTVATKIVTCARCGGPAVPDDAPSVACTYCGAQVVLPDDVRGQAAATKQKQGRSRTAEIIAKLRDQPRAGRANAWLLALSFLMFGAWPLGWGIMAYRVLDDGFQATDLLFLALPFAAVLAGFFLARARLADRGALQLLTLGFGALAPVREGQPSRCRRCQGPLPPAGLGGVTPCRYCGSENIVGIDLRPGVDQARSEQNDFDRALQSRKREKRLWTTLSLVAGLALLCWIGGTAAYIATMVPADIFDDPSPPSRSLPPAPTSPLPPAAHPAAPAMTPPPRRVAPLPAPAPSSLHKGRPPLPRR